MAGKMKKERRRKRGGHDSTEDAGVTAKWQPVTNIGEMTE